MKSQGEIEAAVCEGMTRFEQEYMGRGPKHIYAHLLGDLLVVRLEGVLTAADRQLVCLNTGRMNEDAAVMSIAHRLRFGASDAAVKDVRGLGAQGLPICSSVNVVPAHGGLTAQRFHPLDRSLLKVAMPYW